MTRPGGASSSLTSFDAVRHVCRYAVWAALQGNHQRREQMRGQLQSGDLAPEWAGWVDGERG